MGGELVSRIRCRAPPASLLPLLGRRRIRSPSPLLVFLALERASGLEAGERRASQKPALLRACFPRGFHPDFSRRVLGLRRRHDSLIATVLKEALHRRNPRNRAATK